MIIRQQSDHIEIDAPAKINWFLELLGKREDGFHEIDTLMQTVSLWDHLSVRQNTTGDIRLHCQTLDHREHDTIPNDQRNLVVRACQQVKSLALREQLATDLPGLTLELRKWIPSAAGLGGASSDGAAALVAANLAWKLGLSQQQLVELAAQLGSDVPFFLFGGAARCQGRGEVITPVDSPEGVDIVIAKPPISLSTGDVFSNVQIDNARVDVQPVLAALASGRPSAIAACQFNRLQQVACSMTEQIQQLADHFESLDSLGHQMSGSGSSYFGIFNDRQSAELACQQLSQRLPDHRVFAVGTLSAAAQVSEPQIFSG